MRNTFLGYNADIKSSIKGTCVYCLRLSVVIHTLTKVHKCTKFHKQVIGTNIIYKFIMPEVVCCCLQTCNFVLMNSYHGTSVCQLSLSEDPVYTNPINKLL